MEVGILTAPFRGDDLATVVQFASSAGFDGVEVAVGTTHCNFEAGIDPGEFQAAFDAAGLRISSLAAYCDVTAGDDAEREENRALVRRSVDFCGELDCDVVCTLAGMPPAGMSKEECISESAVPFFTEICREAADSGIKIALENYWRTNIQHLRHWEQLFDSVDADNFGLNFDPSHLYWQDIDYLMAVDWFADRIFHTHAKDTEVVTHKRRVLGNQDDSWWRYVVPGFGDIDWGIYCARLRNAGYNGVLSIEHEDGALGREEGFRLGLQYLRQFADGS